jgi:hypothetical protein
MATPDELAEMGAFNKPYRDNGVIHEAAGFLASTHGARVVFNKGSDQPTVKRGPFGLENLVAGYWVLNLNSIEQAIEWAKKIPFKTGSVEIRKMAAPEDFGDPTAAELIKQQQEAELVKVL